MQEKSPLSPFKILSGSVIKLIAILSMLIDHTALLLYSEISLFRSPLFSVSETGITLYYIMRTIGRLALPIFCFLAVEGFSHTKNLKKYIFSLFAFAVISEIPFNFMISGNLFHPEKQNIYFTLLLGILSVCILEKTENELKKAIGLIFISIFTLFLHVDYGLNGVLLILLLYALRARPAVKTVLSYPLLSGGIAAFLAFIPINMYNGKRGFIKSPFLKYVFYIFYPLHITVLLIIKFLLN